MRHFPQFRFCTLFLTLTLATLPLQLSSCASLRSPSAEEIVDLRTEVERCPLHDELLPEDEQPISNGHQSFDGSYYRLRDALFPMDNQDLHMLGTSGTALVSYCPKCRFAKAKCNRDESPPRLAVYAIVDPDGYEQEMIAFIERQRRELDAEYPSVSRH